jgi:hypothetical protein
MPKNYHEEYGEFGKKHKLDRDTSIILLETENNVRFICYQKSQNPIKES